jgi:hypothetical protein
MRKWIAVAGLVLLGGLANAQTVNVAGEWRGIWTNPEGMVFSATMKLETGKSCKTCAVVGDGAVWGKIVWTLRKAGENPSAHGTIQYNLPQNRIPLAWYNIAADLPKPMAPPLHPGTLKPIGRTIWRRCFR